MCLLAWLVKFFVLLFKTKIIKMIISRMKVTISSRDPSTPTRIHERGKAVLGEGLGIIVSNVADTDGVILRYAVTEIAVVVVVFVVAVAVVALGEVKGTAIGSLD